MMRCPSAVRTTTPTSPGRPSSSDDVDGWAQHRLGERVGDGATDVSRGIAEPNSHLADARGPHGAGSGALEPEKPLVRAAAVRTVVSVQSSVQSSQHQMSAGIATPTDGRKGLNEVIHARWPEHAAAK